MTRPARDKHELARLIGGRIAAARKAEDMTQAGLAEVIDKARASVVQYEAGRILTPLDVIHDIADALHTKPEHLAFGMNGSGEGGRGKRVAVPIMDCGPTSSLVPREEAAEFPISVLGDDLGGGGEPRLVRLDVSAPRFGLASGDMLIINANSEIVAGDGKLYVVPTSAGLGVIQSVVQFGAGSTGFLLQDGDGHQHELSEKPTSFGRVGAALVKK